MNHLSAIEGMIMIPMFKPMNDSLNDPASFVPLLPYVNPNCKDDSDFSVKIGKPKPNDVPNSDNCVLL